RRVPARAGRSRLEAACDHDRRHLGVEPRLEAVAVTATPREGNLVTVKLDRDVVARLAALKVTYGRRSYSEVIRDLLRIK
ncbi:MAG TPA: ribbon-helix-helix protein, CopG family, partial [Methanoculleus sp.]|nr:ribbon-helix-helix protein, CopG family [Methanoculleus sp.]